MTLKRWPLIAAAAAASLWVWKGLDPSLTIESYTVKSRSLPRAFDQSRIAILSDLHGNLPQGLEQAVCAQKPDWIFACGDIADGYKDWKDVFALLGRLARQAPVYFVRGNHEKYRRDWPDMKESLEASGIHVLENEKVLLRKSGQAVELYGLDDPMESLAQSWKELQDNLAGSLQKLEAPEGFSMALLHRASLLDVIKDYGFDAVFSGHIHGGQWRIFNRGILGPRTRFPVEIFPKYDGGFYRHKNTAMIVSRGLSDNMKAPRLYNPPCLVGVVLERI